MRFDGRWAVRSGEPLRPVIRGAVGGRDGREHVVDFLVDSGADRTVLSYDVLVDIDVETLGSGEQLEGVGGSAEAVAVDIPLWLIRETGDRVLFRGPFRAFTDPAALDMSVLGRDVMSNFAIVVDRPGDTVCLLGGRHRYVIQEA